MNTGREVNRDLLGEFVGKVIKTKGIPGLAVGILCNGETLAAGFGVTDVENPMPVTDETLFQIGSITKTFTATAVMRLVEMGKLDLEATVRKYLPDFRVLDETASSQATIRHLLTHTGGWEGDYFDDTGSGDDALARYVTNMAELEQLAPVGTVCSYCNCGFSLVGRVIEVVTGKSYQAALKELVLSPLGLDSSYFEPGDVMTHRFVVGHGVTEDGCKVARPWALPRSLYPAGGITCDIRDLLRYARFHLGDGRVDEKTTLLSSESMRSMQSPQVTVWKEESVGISWWIRELDGLHLLAHNGGTVGQMSLLMLVPERDFAVAVLTNADRGEAATREISRWALKQYLEVDMPDPEPVESPEAELSCYVGRYDRPYTDIELGMLAGRLVGQLKNKRGFPTRDTPPAPPPPPMSLGLCEKDRLVIMDGAAKGMKVDLIRKEDGSIGWLRFATRIHVRRA